MSRKGKLPVQLPKGIEAKLDKGVFSVKGPKGTLTLNILNGLELEIAPNSVLVKIDEAREELKPMHGLYRALVNNMVDGVHHGFEKRLEMIGVGYRAAVQGHHLDVQVGQSHPLKLDIPQGINVKIEKNLIIITGPNKQAVGQFAAEIRAAKPPEPYQGKGIRYVGEYVRKKAGKAAAKK
jgi:large subunit ribosomal protein L6